MKKFKMKIFAIILILLSGCSKYHSPDPRDFAKDSGNNKKLYIEQYDPIADKGQYWLPKQKLGTNYWTVVNATSNKKSFNDNNLQNHILAESIIGLTALAVNEGTNTTMVWTDSPNSNYSEILKQIGLVYNGTQTTWQLLAKDEIKKCIDGYVLCKVRNEESLNVATIASHVYRSVIVDEFYENQIKQLGYKLKYDARFKTTKDAWAEFKDKCNNDALVLMPTLTGNLKSFAIAHRLMFVNYNKKMGRPSSGNNKAVFEEILDWLKPNSPVLGWESGIGEDGFVGPVSKSGNMMVPSDWIWNTTMMSGDYENRQPGLAQVTNPHFVNFNDSIDYVSFFLTDGDNVQWMMNSFRSSDYYLNPLKSDLKMSFGLPVANLSMISPYQLNRILSEQSPDNTLIETLGGGYYYADNFGIDKNRKELLNSIAQKISSHMRQHRIKVLGLITRNKVTSTEAKEAYQAYISNNDQLIGIIAIQYSPYTGGNGKIMWFKNKNGIDIPVITARYAIWNHGNRNFLNEGTPTYIAHRINSLASKSKPSFTLVADHAWSKFKDIGNSDNELAENYGGNISGLTPVSWCKRKLNPGIKVVNVEELIWQLRMHERPEQTKEFLSNYY